MTGDFGERLGLQLREAAEREARRGPVARAAMAARAGSPSLTPARALLVAAIIASVVPLLYAARLVSRLGRQDQAPPGRGVVARFTVGESLNSVAGGFGAGWVDDQGRGLVLRVDPQTHRVTARIPVPGDAELAVGAGSVWALGSTQSTYELDGPLVRIDPRTNRVVARIPLRTARGEPFTAWRVHASRDAVWLVGFRGAFRLDPATNRFTSAVAVGARGYQAESAALGGSDLWLSVSDGHLLRLDPRTGARKAVLRARGTPVIVGRALILMRDLAAARVNPATGRAAWQAPLGTTWAATAAAGAVWVNGAAGAGPFARLTALDARTGRVRRVVATGEFQPSALAPVGSDIWLTTLGGRVVVVRP
jgi:outer membrane protein assembly factor BamB